VRRELDAIGRVFPGRRLLNSDFIISRLEDEVGKRLVSIVHIASHGRFEAEASRSFLLTWDGPLSMERMSELVRRTRFRDEPIELLTLSACETAAGDEDAALGLAGVALRAGARSALATLWTVNDRVTARLISAFYAELAKPGVSRAAALRRAQLATLGEAELRHPAHWAPFLLISSWL
jgi:CHAT domain-containing protein